MLKDLLELLAVNAIGESAFDDFIEQLQHDANTKEAYTQYANKALSENPDDAIGKIALLMADYIGKRPQLDWNWPRMREIADVIGPLADLMRKIDPQCELDIQLDALMGQNAVLTCTASQYTEWGIFGGDVGKFAELIEKADIVAIGPLLDEQFVITIEFNGVRKPVGLRS